jgi:membrane associated rhomboid family serine protease
VGYQCVDCVNEGRRTQRRAVTIAGAEVNAKPLVVPIMIAINVAIFVLTAVQAQSIANNDQSLSFDIGMLWPPAAASGEWWRLFTNGFLHFGPIHLVLNMLSLYIIGRELEVLFGRVRFLALYLVSLVGGSVAVFLFSQPEPARTSLGEAVLEYGRTAGASGAIFGLMGALAVAVFRLKLPMGQALGIIALNIVFSFTFPNISWLAHIGGLVTGALVALGMLYPPARIRNKVQIATLAGVMVLLIGLAFVRDGQFTRQVECTYQGERMACFSDSGSST